MKTFIIAKSRVVEGRLVTADRYREEIMGKDALRAVTAHLKSEYYSCKHNIEEAFKIGATSYCKREIKELQFIRSQLNRAGVLQL
jgi:hypothetical protein